jgi:hypothetical protein
MITVTLWALILFTPAGEPTSSWSSAPHYATWEICDMVGNRYFGGDPLLVHDTYLCIPQNVQVRK